MSQIWVQWSHFLTVIGYCVFWWCFITKVSSVHHIIIALFINGVCYKGSSQMSQIWVQWSHYLTAIGNCVIFFMKFHCKGMEYEEFWKETLVSVMEMLTAQCHLHRLLFMVWFQSGQYIVLTPGEQSHYADLLSLGGGRHAVPVSPLPLSSWFSSTCIAVFRGALVPQIRSFFLTLFKKGGGDQNHVQKFWSKFCMILKAFWQQKLT